MSRIAALAVPGRLLLLSLPLLLLGAAPAVAAPAVAVPPVAVPSVAVPSVAVPSAAVPPVAAPPVAAPPVALPSVAMPAAGSPPAGLPPAGLPSAAMPSAAMPAAGSPAGTAYVAGLCPGQEVPPGPPAEEEAAPVAPLPVPDPPVGGLTGCAEAHAGPVPPPPVGVASYLVADLDSGAVLAARAPHARHRPASTIKLLLALVVDDGLPPERIVTGTVEDANIEGSRAGIGPGGRYSVEQLLHGLLLASGNDAAHALARELGGTPATLAAMRDTARGLGALDTRPATPSGLDGPGMSSSAYDLALVLREALDRPRIAAVLRAPGIAFPGFADRPGFELGNGDRMFGTPGFLGGKNGFTDAARHTYVGAVERDGRRLVVALVRGEPQPLRMVDQARALLDWGFGVTANGIGTLVAQVPPGGGEPAAPGSPAAPGDPAAQEGSGPAEGAGSSEGSGSSEGTGPSGDPEPSGGAPEAGAEGAGPAEAAVVGGVAAAVGVVAAAVAVLRRRLRR
ncbi:D-alanyl-D-alanine carboxypeptidase (penicillin-binding protein 5/6) [Pseudonocardia autotrophica]|uniref:D-alanyl-D-alanine carboxypeptidase DacD n=1 Tax=Pseudonocardia autotrophica TaxID=2074 RepID=A0A1Y2MQY4_PSEAH|nr:D-alanyl-D-alanine carboxypeptidase DacD precursor [Pseudonocardia autotrophica]TDN73764.1 D-alanyl-D-alanine carboxypeptidase (penicillin-binding protein 5/6) [Pseudonocardia autotrophica]